MIASTTPFAFFRRLREFYFWVGLQLALTCFFVFNDEVIHYCWRKVKIYSMKAVISIVYLFLYAIVCKLDRLTLIFRYLGCSQCLSNDIKQVEQLKLIICI